MEKNKVESWKQMVILIGDYSELYEILRSSSNVQGV